MTGEETRSAALAGFPLRIAFVFPLLLALSSCGGEEAEKTTDSYPLSPTLTAAERMASDQKWAGVQSVVEKRCVVCHGCYDAPCQLKLSSPDGLLRGASKEPVYKASRLKNAPLTRLGIDAGSEAEWRTLGFFPVQHNPAISEANPSVLSQLLEHGRANPPPENAPLPSEIDLDIKRELACPAPGETDAYIADHPHGGMPFATAPLSGDEYELLADWARSGAPLPGGNRDIPDKVADRIGDIEAYLNGESGALVARYIYEHLFLAHLHIEGDDPRHFFRIIRSRTPPGEAADEIATRRPFDNPGRAPFHYRLIPIDGTILHKEHMVYGIGPERLARYRALFSGTPPSVTEPGYSDAAGGNPFTTFAAMPAEGRYRFLLDDALYFVRSFIRGPVCHGQVAVDVIEDRFWVSFLDPKSDLSVTDPSYLQAAAPLLDLPVSAIGGDLKERASKFLSEGPAEYLRFRDKRYNSAPSHADGLTYDDIWDGDGTNTSARLTIYRHFDNASVVTGFAGAVPETAWVIDFPLFERIYYDLVAGFDVFGSVEHQLTTRLYMDGLRREGETIFLSFLPPDVRKPLHDEWYHGPLASLIDWVKEQPVDISTPTGIDFATGDPKAEFLDAILKRGEGLWPLFDPINRCSGDDCAPDASIAGQLRELASRDGPWVKFLPDLAILLVGTDSGRPLIFSLVHDKAHANVAFLFREESRREPENDRLTIIEGQLASYPNFYFRVDKARLPEFVVALAGMETQSDYMQFVHTYGVRRGSAEFWPSVDAVQDALDSQDALQSGLLDINRYKDPKTDDPVE